MHIDIGHIFKRKYEIAGKVIATYDTTQFLSNKAFNDNLFQVAQCLTWFNFTNIWFARFTRVSDVVFCWHFCHSDAAPVAPLIFHIVSVIYWQDGDPPGCGTTTTEIGDPASGFVRVKWDAGWTGYYRMGDDGRYELCLANEWWQSYGPHRK